jgi:hypothetical protein
MERAGGNLQISMSEHRAAAHISGIWGFVGLLVAAIIGAGALWYQSAANKDVAKLQPAANPVAPAELPKVKPDSAKVSQPSKADKATASPANPIIQAGAQERVSVYDAAKAAVTAAPTPSDISLFEFYALLHDRSASPVQQLKSVDPYLGKEVSWIGYFDQLSGSYPKSDTETFSVSIWVGPNGPWGTWCDVPRRREPVVAALTRGHPFRVRGVLKTPQLLVADSIELIETSPIALDDYLRLLSTAPSLVNAFKQHVGKQVTWEAELTGINPYPDDPRRQYRLVLKSRSPERFDDYVYCYLSADAEDQIKELHKGSFVRLTGVLVGRTDVKLTSIATITK